jgi:hypothetical protein
MLKQAGWKNSDLLEVSKGDKTKARMAAKVRAETTMSWAWVAQELCMGHWRSAANSVRRLQAPPKG